MIDSQNIQMQKARDYAISRGGICLSDNADYTNSQSRLTWKCEDKDHPAWTGVFHTLVSQKRWCPACKTSHDATSKQSESGLKDAQAYALSKGGVCLSETYVNNKTSMLWTCHNPDHKPWSAKFNTLKMQGTWCKECHAEKQLWHKNKPNKLLEAKKYAIKRNGKLLSKNVVSEKIKLEWKCNNLSHKSWKADLSHAIHLDQWCPECANLKNKTENRVRLFLETFYGFELSSTRPDWNRNPKTGNKLELDGYNQENKIAFEHDGEHHFEHTSYSSSISEQVFKKQVQRDKVKKSNCKKHGVKLISIPIAEKKLRYKFFPLLRHVKACCDKQGVNLTYTYSQIKQMYQVFEFLS